MPLHELQSLLMSYRYIIIVLDLKLKFVILMG